MTVKTKPSIVIKKPDGSKLPLVLDNDFCDEEKVDIYPPESPPPLRKPNTTAATVCLILMALMVAVVGVSCGLMLYRHYMRASPVRRYRGFCTIPLEPPRDYKNEMLQGQTLEPNYRESLLMPLHWTSQPFDQVYNDPPPKRPINDDVDVFEEFDVGDQSAVIRVFEDKRTIIFVHDFENNVTGIVEPERCFMMDRDPSVMLLPEMLMAGIDNQGAFDVSPVESTLRAVLPALVDLTRKAEMLLQYCKLKPTYKLQKEKNALIHKRSAEAPAFDFIQFAGKHMQKIKISNLHEVEELEKKQQA